MEWNKENLYKAKAFLLTFLAYTCFHLVRKPPSVVKSVLHPVSSSGISAYDPITNPGWAPFNNDIVPEKVSQAGFMVATHQHSDIANYLDGLFSCNETISVCKKYVNSNGAVMTHGGPGTGIRCPDTIKEPCWLILRETPRQRIYYAQEYGGLLPAQFVSSDAPDVIHWKFKTDDGVFEEDQLIRVIPDMRNGGSLLGLMDTAFLGCYTIGLFVSGYLGDRMNLRVLVSVGMWGSGASLFMLSLAHVWKIHKFSYFLAVNMVFGFFQSIGWPCVVAIMGKWFGHGARGTIMGIWNCHTSVGNILGSIITAASVSAGMHHEDWPLGYFIPGLIIFICGFFVFATLVPYPEDVGLATIHEPHHHHLDSPLLQDDEETSDSDEVPEYNEEDRTVVATLKKALSIPGVIPYSLSLLFCKMTSYSLLFWGPYYLGSVGFSSSKAGYLCSFFDIGGMFGGMMAGYLSDRYPAAVVAFTFQILSVPVMLFYFGQTSAIGPKVTENILLMILNGFFVNAPYALITTAVTADLGTRVEGDAQLLSFVTGLIDGTGSCGAMLQGILVGYMSAESWASVWHMLCVAQLLSAAMIFKLFYHHMEKGF